VGSDSEENLAPVRAGDVLARKYRVERVLGVGGMGVVVAATHLQLSQRVALKFLLPAALANPGVVARFAREARAAAQIRSEHVARVLDVAELESGLPYMVMEYLEGRDLAQELEARGPLPVEEAVGHVLQACEAIAEAHAVGIVHRDLKPANLFLTRRADGSPTIKVLDFGISKSPIGPEGDLTRTQGVMGSPYYMSPEQMTSSRDVDARTDIWALGVILYELLTGRCPFQAETMPQLVAAILGSPPAPLAVLRHDLPVGLSPVVLRCLEKARDARATNVAELCAELEPFAAPECRVSVVRVSRVLGAAVRVKQPAAARLNASFSFDEGQSGETVPLLEHARPKPAVRTVDASSWGSTAAPSVVARPAKRPTLGIIAFAVLVLGGLVTVALSLRRREVPTIAAASSSPRTIASPPAAPLETAPPIAAPIEPKPTSSPAASSSPALRPAQRPPPQPSLGRTVDAGPPPAAPSPATPATPKSAATVSCDPFWYIDPHDNTKKVKPGC